MKKTIILILFFLTACSDFGSDIEITKRNGIYNLADHFNKICGFELPPSIELLHEFDTGEGWAEAIYIVDKKDLGSFISQNKFIPLDTFLLPWTKGLSDEGKKEVLAEGDLKDNHEEKYKLENHSNLMVFQKCTKKNYFRLIADTTANLLWFKNEYPDHGGLGPKCN